MNVHFDNFGYNELVSKNAKDRLKKYLKSTIDNEKDIKDQLEAKTEELLEKYFKKINGKVLKLNYNVEENGIHLNLEVNDKVLTQREINQQKLKNKLAQARSQRFQARDRKKFLENEKLEKKMLTADPRVSNDMIQKYNLARAKFGQQLPNPQVILDNKSEHVKKYVEYVGMIIKNSQTEDQMLTMLDNEYSHYINTVTGFDYKAIIDSFKQNMQNTKKDEVKEGPIFEKLDEIAEESDEEEQAQINSDDYTDNSNIVEKSSEIEETMTTD